MVRRPNQGQQIVGPMQEHVLTKPNESEKPLPPTATPKDGEATTPWDKLIKGSRCLAKSTEPNEDGYYLATVEDVSADGKTLTLKWFGYPGLASFKTRRLAVGIICK